ncbi:hypothetical protein [Winogradskyella sp.]|jgi:hypothetical protein|uniref:hypothetical protein n=1 Tax=Winogradskyella sp. TaxID=1883156 RepID=UPI003AB4BA2C
MKVTITIIFLFLASSICTAQNSSKQSTQITNIYEMFDFVHKCLYRGSAEQKESLSKLKGRLANQYFTQKERRTLNSRGELLLSKIQSTLADDSYSYGFQYCRLPLEKEQTDSTFVWYNKDKTATAYFTMEMEDGILRLFELEVEMITDVSHRKKIETQRCTNLTYGPVVRGKRKGISELKLNDPVLVYNEDTDYWREAIYKGKAENGLYQIEFYNQYKKSVKQIVPIEVLVNDRAYHFLNNEYKLVFIEEVNNKKLTISSYEFKDIVDRKDLYYSIDANVPVNYDNRLFLRN